MSITQKDTIYIDIDDEITSVIEKVNDSKSKILALVLPKRAAVLQSTVNMRLLKRAAKESNKSVVLITSETALLPLAGVVGLHVARTLNSKPAIPPAPDTDASHITIDDYLSSSDVEELVDIDPKTTVGELAGDAMPNEDEPIVVDYDEDDQANEHKTEKPVKDKKLKVPNFDRFRTIILLGGGALVMLLTLGIWAFVVAPKSTITISTNTSPLSSSVILTASTSAKTLDKAQQIVPASTKESKKTDTQKVPATGEKNNGTKAGGTMTVFYCPSNDNTQISLPAGSAFVNNGVVFRTNVAVTVPASNFLGGGTCKKDLSQNVAVTSEQAGDKYNLSSRSYIGVDNSAISGTGSAMSGGTSKMVKVVSQSDVDAAKLQMLDRTKTAAITELTKQFNDANMFALTDTITAVSQTATSSPSVNEEASETTVGLNVTYAMTGISKSDLKLLVEASVKDKIDLSKEQIQDEDYGLGKASVKIQEKKANGDTKVEIQFQLSIGPKLEIDALKKEVAGKKRGDVVNLINSRPGVKDVSVRYSPFWVMSTPSNPSKITIVLEKINDNK